MKSFQENNFLPLLELPERPFLDSLLKPWSDPKVTVMQTPDSTHRDTEGVKQEERRYSAHQNFNDQFAKIAFDLYQRVQDLELNSELSEQQNYHMQQENKRLRDSISVLQNQINEASSALAALQPVQDQGSKDLDRLLRLTRKKL
jgi:hypothetical protein